MIAYEIASSMIGITMWCYLGGLIGLVWGCKGVLGQMAQDREVRTEAKAFVRDFIEGRHNLPADLLDNEEVDNRFATFASEERPVRSSRPGPLALRLQAAHNRNRSVLATPIGYGGGSGLRLMRARPALLV